MPGATRRGIGFSSTRLPRSKTSELTVSCTVHIHELRWIRYGDLNMSSTVLPLGPLLDSVIRTYLNRRYLPWSFCQWRRVVVWVFDFAAGETVGIPLDESPLLIQLLAREFRVHVDAASGMIEAIASCVERMSKR